MIQRKELDKEITEFLPLYELGVKAADYGDNVSDKSWFHFLKQEVRRIRAKYKDLAELDYVLRSYQDEIEAFDKMRTNDDFYFSNAYVGKESFAGVETYDGYERLLFGWYFQRDHARFDQLRNKRLALSFLSLTSREYQRVYTYDPYTQTWTPTATAEVAP